jgi:shikimate dehydrogenase
MQGDRAMPVTRRAAVLGSPIAHSLSPALHSAAYAALGLDWAYDRIECTEDDLPSFVDSCGPEWVGLSLTMPLKRVGLELAAEASPAAAAVGAANTLLLRDGRRYAENTDVPGMVDALGEAGVSRVEAAVVLGAGGTAQAAIAALATLGERHPTVVVREPARAAVLLEAADRLGVQPVIRSLEDSLPSADVVISTVPKGAADRFATAEWPRRTVLFDVVYDPWPTPLAAAALRSGARVVSGLDLLLHQAGHQVRLMTDRPAPLEAMRAALPG